MAITIIIRKKKKKKEEQEEIQKHVGEPGTGITGMWRGWGVGSRHRWFQEVSAVPRAAARAQPGLG